MATAALSLTLAGCASQQFTLDEPSAPSRPGAGTTPEFVIAKPPSRVPATSGESDALNPADLIAPGVPRLVWVPAWRLYLREGHDAVYHDGAYYLYAHGRWYVSDSDRGPWRAVARPESTTAAPQAGKRQPDVGSSTPGKRVKPESPPSSPPPIDQVAKPPTGPALAGDRVAHLASRHVGAPYAWGGSSPAGFDCSGFVMYVYARVGVSLPHNAARQYAYGIPVGRDQLKPGDLVFFDRVRHNGIYIGRGQFVHASQRGSGVKISRLEGPWFSERWIGARRLLPPASAANDQTSPVAVSTSR